jgi:hypothetical protein
LRFQYLAGVVFLMFLRICEAQVRSTFVVPGNPGGQSSIAVADLDGDTSNGLEVVMVTLGGTVTAVRADGSILWSRDTPNKSCPFSSANDKVFSSPVVGKLFGGSVPYVVLGYGGFAGKACDGGVLALRGDTGANAWVFSIKKWAKRRGFDAFRNSVYGTPALSDVDGDGKLEVGFGSFDRNIYLLNHNGTVRWYYNAADTVFSTAAFADVDEFGNQEMLIGTDISQNKRISPPTPNGGFLYAFRTTKPEKSGFRYLFRDVKLQIWRTEFDQVVQSSPVIGELISENPGEEVVIGTGCFFPQGGNDRRGKYFRVLSVRTGKVLRTLNVTACAPSTPALGDLDGDGKLEVVVTVSGDASTGGDGKSHVVAWNPQIDSVLWDVEPYLQGRTDRFGGHYNRTPTIADITGDGRPEVLTSYANGVVVLDGLSGEHLTCTEKPCTKPLLASEGNITGTPRVVDSNQDGRPEVLVAGRQGGNAALVRWEDINPA